MRRLSVLTFTLLSLALFLAACGADDGPAGGSSSDDGVATAAETQAQGGKTTSNGCAVVDEPKTKRAGRLAKPKLRLDAGRTYTAVLDTSCGVIEIELATKDAPKTSASFVSLVRKGFYDGLAFHRIVPDFVAQGGDPKGTGEGGPGYEVVEAPPQDLRYTEGVVAMAKTEMDPPGTSGSQFFIVTAPDAGLPPDYALLGRVSKGDDVLERLGRVPNDPADNRPIEPVVIEKATIRES